MKRHYRARSARGRRVSNTSQDRGRSFEREVARDTGLEPVSRSGAGTYKLDVGAGSELRVELKHTDHASFRIDEDLLARLDAATSGPAGVGADKTGVVVTRIGALDRVVATLDWQDLVALLRSDAVGVIQPTKDDRRRAQADVPSYLRE